jgi:hypothetical protein
LGHSDHFCRLYRSLMDNSLCSLHRIRRGSLSMSCRGLADGDFCEEKVIHASPDGSRNAKEPRDVTRHEQGGRMVCEEASHSWGAWFVRWMMCSVVDHLRPDASVAVRQRKWASYVCYAAVSGDDVQRCGCRATCTAPTGRGFVSPRSDSVRRSSPSADD